MVTLTLSGLHVGLRGRDVLHGLDATLVGGTLTAVVGPNGAGKSTLARAMTGLLRPAAGCVRVDDVDVAALRPVDRARRIAYLPQGATLGWPLSVERLVGLGRLPHLAPFNNMTALDQAAIERAMARTGVLSLRQRVATELSGGELTRVLLARALAVQASVIIVDEPLAALDLGHQFEVMELLAAEAREGALVVAVVHELTMAACFCDRVMLIDQGRIVADGAAEMVLDVPNLAAVYGIEAWQGEIDGMRFIVPLRRPRKCNMTPC